MYGKVFDVDIDEVFNESRREVGSIKRDYSIYDDFEKALSQARTEVDEIFKEKYKL